MHDVERILTSRPKATAVEISEELGISRARVYHVCAKAGIKPGKQADSPPKKQPKKQPTNRDAWPEEMNASFKGEISELAVARDLMLRGMHVYRALTNTSPCDMIASGSGGLARVEVRTGKIVCGQYCAAQPESGRYDVFAIVTKDGRIHYRRRPGFEWVAP